MRVGVIDIGSNALRLMIAEGTNYDSAEVICEERVSLRLGHDAFQIGELSDSTRWKFYQAMLKFRLVTEELQVDHIQAVATSALRNSKNSKSVISDVKRISGIGIELISGQREAKILKMATDKALPRISKNALAMDVGGGSAEFSTGHFGASLPLGTVRLLEQCHGRSYEDFALVIRPYLLRLRSSLSGRSDFVNMIGTGGNLKSIARLTYRLRYSPNKNSFTFLAAQNLTKKLFSMTADQRRNNLKLDLDRADVILPASCLLVEACRIFKIRNIYAPNVGLKNGLLLEVLGH